MTVLVKHIEFGQGPFTGLATLVAEETGRGLEPDARPSMRRPTSSSTPISLFGVQGTGGSTAIANSYEQMRKAGATARAMLVAGGGRGLEGPGWRDHRRRRRHRAMPPARRAGSASSREAAAKLPVPENPPLKAAAAYQLIGKEGAVKRLDSADKVDGKAQFTIDIHAPDMLTVVVARPAALRRQGRELRRRARRCAVTGVVDVKQIRSGVAVYANGMWPALKGRDAAARSTWDDSARREARQRRARSPNTASSPAQARHGRRPAWRRRGRARQGGTA